MVGKGDTVATRELMTETIISTVDKVVQHRGVRELNDECCAEALLDIVEWCVHNNSDTPPTPIIDKIVTRAVYRILNREHRWSKRHRYLLSQDDFLATRNNTERSAYANLLLEVYGGGVRSGKIAPQIGHWLDFVEWEKEHKNR